MLSMTALRTMQSRLPDFRPVMASYFDGILALGLRTLRLMALALDLPIDWFAERYKQPLLNLRPLHYSAALSNLEEVIASSTSLTRLCLCTPPWALTLLSWEVLTILSWALQGVMGAGAHSDYGVMTLLGAEFLPQLP